MPLLVKALLRVWWRADFALAFARVGLREAEASDCPLRIREWRRAVVWLQWIAGDEHRDWMAPSLQDLVRRSEAT